MSGVDISAEAVERLARMAADLAVLHTAAIATETKPNEAEQRDKLLRSTGYHSAVAATLRALAAALAEAQRDAREYMATAAISAANERDERARRERAEATLHWYAADYDHERGCSQWDGGSKARQALYREPCTDGR